MRTLGSLIVLFLVFGIISPFFSTNGYSQTSVEGDFMCNALSMEIPGTSFQGSGYIFRGYLVNVSIERSGIRIPSCPDQLQTNSQVSWTTMTWPQ